MEKWGFSKGEMVWVINKHLKPEPAIILKFLHNGLELLHKKEVVIIDPEYVYKTKNIIAGN